MSDEEKRKKEEIENQKKEEPAEKKEPEKPKEEKKEVKEKSKETKPTKKSEGLVYLAVVIAAMIVVSGALVYWAFTHHKTIVINNTVKPHIVNKSKPKKINTGHSSSSKILPNIIIYYNKKYNLTDSQLNNITSILNGKVKQILSKMGYNVNFNTTSVAYVELSNNTNVPIVPEILIKIDNSTKAHTLEYLGLITKYNDSYYMFRGFFLKYLYTTANVSYLPLINTTMIIVSGSIVSPDKTTIDELKDIISKESYINVSKVVIASIDNYTNYVNLSLFIFPTVLLRSKDNLSKYIIFLGQMGSYRPKYLGNDTYGLPIMLTQAIFRVLEITKEPNITGLPVLGSSNAKVTIIEFADLHCPYCAMFAKDIENITSTYIKNGTVNYVFVIFPVHPSAMPLHKMLMCYWQLSHNTSDYYKIIQWNYNTFVANNFTAVTPSQFENEVKKYYNIMSVENCVSENGKSLNQTLRNNMEEGMEYGIFGTPGIVIWNNEAHKGIVIVGYINNQTLKTYIQKVLSMS